jgi:hypothetical protein
MLHSIDFPLVRVTCHAPFAEVQDLLQPFVVVEEGMDLSKQQVGGDSLLGKIAMNLIHLGHW